LNTLKEVMTTSTSHNLPFDSSDYDHVENYIFSQLHDWSSLSQQKIQKLSFTRVGACCVGVG